MARYIKKEIVDLNGTGKKQAYYRMQTWRKLDHEEFVKKCTYAGSGVSRAMMDAVLTVVAEELPRLLAMGYSVRIDGLGTFNAKLGVRKDKEQDAFEEGEQKRNAQSIEVNGIGFCFAAIGLNTDFVPALPTALMRPLSGGGARGLMVDAMAAYGADSFVGRLVSIVQGSTDTTFYILAVYFGSVNIKNTRYAVVCGLIADFFGILSSIILAYIFFH